MHHACDAGRAAWRRVLIDLTKTAYLVDIMWLIGTKLVRVALSHKIFLSDPGKGETNPGIQGAVRSRPESAPVI